jgi:adenylate kinase
MVKYEDTKYVKVAIILDVPHQELWKRLEARGRADDTPEAIEKRWGIFEQTIYTMTEKLEAAGVPVVKVDGTGEIPQITERIEQILRERAII